MEEEKEIYTNMEKSKIIEYINQLLYKYNNSDDKNNINPYDQYLKMKLDDGCEFTIPEKIREDTIKEWHAKKVKHKYLMNFDYRFFQNILSTLFFIIGVILFLYILSLLKYVVIR